MLPFMWASQDKCFKSATAVLTNGTTIFTITGGPIEIVELASVCVTANGASATTLQYSSTPTVGSATTISGACATLANATAGTVVYLTPATLATVPTIVTAAGGGLLLSVQTNKIIVKEGTITMVVGTGPTTGTWYHVIRYSPMTPDSLVN